ncbi:MAG: holin [Clostridiales bacterium]|jgi:hypothetical protein|nr:holin [Clostridiales bacterium]
MKALTYVVENAYILIPALYIIGTIIKEIEKIPDKYIPLILLVFGIAGAISILGLSADSVIQGVLLTGVTVYGNQVFKQLSKKDDD